jgi:hypothetical protein
VKQLSQKAESGVEKTRDNCMNPTVPFDIRSRLKPSKAAKAVGNCTVVGVELNSLMNYAILIRLLSQSQIKNPC